MSGGQLLLLLHAHLPYVRHPEQERSLEERWLFETITECYLPLLSRLEALVDAGVEYRITLSLSPPLVSMWQDSLLRERYCRHLGEMIELAEREMLRTRQDPQLSALARYYRDRFRQARDQYERNYGKDILGAWLRLADAGRVELITTGATHGFLPLLRHGPGAVRAQLRVAGDFFEGYAGRRATGVWLPECGYFPGLEDEMAAAGFRYFFVEAHGLLRAAPRPRHGTLAPLACANGVAAFGRDPDCSREVWSRERGFPGHPAYREFHRDIGYELDPAALGPLAAACGHCPRRRHDRHVGNRRPPASDPGQGWRGSRGTSGVGSRLAMVARVRGRGATAGAVAAPGALDDEGTRP